MKIHFYGRLADSFGPDIDFSIAESCSVDDLRMRLAAEHPDAASLLGPPVRACVGDMMVAGDYVVNPNDSVEFLPPVSGG
ncbi:MAG: MoaD/ThiS family protein [Sphingomicrobium sp.]